LDKADLRSELVDRRCIPATGQKDLLNEGVRGCVTEQNIINADTLDAEILLRARKIRCDRENLSSFRQ
jgi:hypothetical protein